VAITCWLGLGLLAACAAEEETIQADNNTVDASADMSVIVANSNGTVEAGTPQRMLTAILDNAGSGYVGGPTTAMTLVYDEVDGNGQVEADGTWRSVEDKVGMYVVEVEFDRPGIWEVTALSGDQELGGALFEVVADSTVPNIGETVPPSVTPTAATAGPGGLAAISTDADPEPAFYELSIADAVSNGRPSLVAFATPSYCRTALCGPTMEAVKVAVADRTDLDVVHVEPFDLVQAEAGDLIPNDVALEWGLPTEPWVFVLDADGRVRARFEGLITADELIESLDGV
jgi:hypothetical protein